MSIVNYSEYIKQLRLRKQMTQDKAAEGMGYHVVSLSRVETGVHLPRAAKLPKGELAFSHLDDQSMDVLAERHRLITALDKHETREAAQILAELEVLPNFDTPVNKQFILSQKARLLEQQGQPPEAVMPLVQEGLRQTYGEAEIEITENTAHILEEAPLFHTMARTYRRMGDLPQAIRILKALESSISKLPTWDKDREKQQVPVLLTLAQCQLQIKDYDEAVQTCIRGFDYSATRSQGLCAPNFLYIQAKAKHALQHNDYAPLLRNAYFCYTMLHKKEAAEELLAAAANMGVIINTYGVDKLEYAPRPKAVYARGELANYKNIGEMIKDLRKKARLTLAELSQGICGVANLQKIETGAIQGKMQYIVPIMQRLGRDAYLYCPFYLKREDFLNAQMQENIYMLQVMGDYKKAAKLINRLKKKKGYDKSANLQFIKMVEALNFSAMQEEPSDAYPDMIMKVLYITCPKFDEHNIESYPLTQNETILIGELANYYVDIQDYTRAAKMYNCLLNNIRKTDIDETEKACIYAALVYNYSRCLGRMGKRHDALFILDEAIDFDRDRERLFLLPELLFNKAYNLYELGKKEESLPCFAQAYYGVVTFIKYGLAEHEKIIKRVIYERFKLAF
ncbi:MAG: helix-turn-helix transcriptional regulator [Defluviitaleaceae bacterium]|nr:helix-turn-helix transcriptional regulator [Defluviitaleaceae bacterium]